MRKITFGGPVAWLTEEQYEKLLLRFSPPDFLLHRGEGDYFWAAPCLCEEFHACDQCPFDILAPRKTWGNLGCHEVLLRAGLEHLRLRLHPEGLSWEPRDDTVARWEAKAIWDALASLPKVEKE